MRKESLKMDWLFGEYHFFEGDMSMDAMAFNLVKPLLLDAIEAEVGQEARQVLESLLDSYYGASEPQFWFNSLTFERVFKLLSVAHEKMGGHSWFDMFLSDSGGKGTDGGSLQVVKKEINQSDCGCKGTELNAALVVKDNLQVEEFESGRRVDFLMKVFEDLFM